MIVFPEPPRPGSPFPKPGPTLDIPALEIGPLDAAETVATAPPAASSAPTSSPAAGSAPPMQDWKELVVWLAALAVLWFVLTALADTGNQRLAYAIAALILGGAVIFLSPKAIDNARKLVQ